MQRPSPSSPVRRVRRVSVAVTGLVVAFALILPSAAFAASFGARVVFPKSNPVMKKKWPLTIQAWKGSTKLSGSTKYQFYSQGTLESTQKGITLRNGTGHDTLVFPAEAVGHPLTLKVLVITKYGTLSFSRNLTTKR
jgi:hypothetical protein